MRGRNTENQTIKKDVEVAEYQEKRHVILKFIHEEKHIVFNSIGMNRRKMEFNDGVSVLLAKVV